MKRSFPIIAILIIVFSLFLCSCGNSINGVKYFYEEENLEIYFPEDMKVFDLNNITVSDTDIEKYDLDYSTLKDLASPDEGGIVYLAKSHDMKKECTVSITATEETIEVWDFTDVKSTEITKYAENEANLLTTEFYTIKAEDEYRKNGMFFIRFDMASSNSKKVDTIYLFTVKNGLRYSFVYFSNDLSQNDIKQAEEIFSSIRVTKDVEKYTQKQTHRLIPVALILATALVITIIFVGVSSVRKQNRQEKENGPYQKQFQSILDEPKQKRNNKK